MNRREKIADWWDGVMARVSIRYPLLGAYYSYRGLRAPKYPGEPRRYSRRDAFRMSKNVYVKDRKKHSGEPLNPWGKR